MRITLGKTLFAVIAATGLALAGCNSDSSSTSTSTSGSGSGSTSGSTGSTTTTSTGSTSGSGGSSGTTGSTVTLEINSGKAWGAANTNLPVGGTLHIVNHDSAPHTVTSEANAGDFSNGAVDGVSFDSGTISAGGSKDLVISGGHAGDVIHFFCNFHTSMMNPSDPTLTLQ